ncbi:hypothetical protein ACFZDJ_09300 [Streptomyces sp. NPDC007896]|uniref:hypothetical protein n=1 Tax=unclassified Streptomyces TaxID=2593676 RepID=UPI0036F02E71
MDVPGAPWEWGIYRAASHRGSRPAEGKDVQHLPAEIVLVDDLVVPQAFVTRLDRMQGVFLATLQPVEVVDSPAGAGRGSQAW